MLKEGLGAPQPGYFSLWSNSALSQGWELAYKCDKTRPLVHTSVPSLLILADDIFAVILACLCSPISLLIRPPVFV